MQFVFAGHAMAYVWCLQARASDKFYVFKYVHASVNRLCNATSYLQNFVFLFFSFHVLFCFVVAVFFNFPTGTHIPMYHLCVFNMKFISAPILAKHLKLKTQLLFMV